MKFNDFVKEGKVKKNKIADQALIISLIKTSREDLKFLNSLKVNDSSARKLTISYYDTLRSVLEAVAAQKGYKVYSHEAYVYFLKELGENVFSIKFDRFRMLRNKLNYYGESITSEEVKEIIAEIISMIAALNKKYFQRYIK